MNSTQGQGLQEFIFVYGPPGSGKTTLGRQLASDLALPFTDLDLVIVSGAGRTIPEIFAAEGEAGFRIREKATLSAVLSGVPGVVALGGGALLDDENRRRVEAAGRVICLDAPLETLTARLQAEGGRPLLSGNQPARLAVLVEARKPHYASFPVRMDSAQQPPESLSWEAQVQLGRFFVRGMGPGYRVVVREGVLNQLGEAVRATGPVVVVSDDCVGGIYGERAMQSLRHGGFSPASIVFPAGEENKTVGTVLRMWDAFLEAGLERGSAVIALGGGVTGDLAGFAAATYQRGIPWIAAPTSLLAMVDASLGGKTGADLPQGKNLVGAFHPPQLVLADPQLLSTLPEPELRSGMAEVVKAGVIGDPALFALCAGGWAEVQKDWAAVIRRAMGVKIRVILDDPYERGQRAMLNLGHTFGHAVEVLSGYKLRHGEAVSLGIVLASRLSERLGLAQVGLAGEIETVLHGLGLPVRLPEDIAFEAIDAAMRYDKKRAGGKLRFVLPIRIGDVRAGVEVDDWQSVMGG